MAKRTNKKAEKKENEFKEFNLSEETFDYTGRVYPWEESGNGVKRAYLSLCINESITINYCHLVQSKDNLFISFPSIKSGDNYKSVIFTAEDMNEELDKVAEEIANLIDG